MSSELGKLLLLLGILLAVVGLIMTLLPGTRLGRLPGDITISWKKGEIYLPFATCIVLSVVLSLILSLILYLRK